MGWPRKNDQMRLYRDKQNAYVLVFVDDERRGLHDALANVYDGSSPSLCGTQVSDRWFVQTWPKRVEWSDLPTEWKEAFMRYMDDDEHPFRPEEIRGLWKVGHQPTCHGTGRAL
jgi:hypothetical protein